MIIDAHAHLSAPAELYAWKSGLLAHRGAHGRGAPRISDDQLRAAHTDPHPSFGNVSHMDHIDGAGVDVQLISPRPYQMMHSEQGKLVQWFTEETNDLIHRSTELFPGRFLGVAGLPQSPELEPAQWAGELRRTVTELGFVGAMLNPDPFEGTATPPALGDRYWYPLYEALCELDVPALIHAAGCRRPAREPYSLHFIQEETVAIWSLLNSSVLRDFPELKIVVSHGGGAIPYQVGRFLPSGVRSGATPYLDKLRNLYFDTCLYTQDAIELLIRTVGVDRCLFGTEKPGTGSQINPENGRWFDDIHLLVNDIGWLTDADRTALFEGNARAVFPIDAGGPARTA
ncbi:amidohydrolase [Actinomadura sp. KC216]|uniref:amidohydrolase family protein n=1 Tax=Actinomadura sp. KC216 TaxID=2530370 RepID=UPI00104A48DD|nr:amidohydrolase family protein [Actinomadura sp. KC216]TDB85016.1 amidohydrolase [Actinomadura sp. KC216]